jgi:peptidoglycan biosynthesis protein MviN/MurJ (putative lipid II flippase)
MGSVLLQSRLLFARRRLKLVAWTAIGAILLNVLLDAVLVRFAGIYGIALATSAVTLGCFLFLRALVNSDVGMVYRDGDVYYAIKVIGSAIFVALSAWAWALSFERFASVSSELLRGVEVFGGLSIGAAVYLASLKVAGVREGADLVRRFWNMLSRPRLTDTP